MAQQNPISEMLPDYVNGLLSEEDTRRIDLAAQENPEIAAEIEFCRHIKSTVNANSDENGPGELGWARLSRAISAEAKASAAPSSSPLWKYAAAAFGFIALGQAVMLVASTQPSSGNDVYVTASEQQSEPIYLKVGFVANASEADIRELLLSVDGQITAGPTALGLFQIRFDTLSARDNALQEFTQSPNIIETAAAE